MRAVIYLCLLFCSVALGQNLDKLKNMPKYDNRYDYLELDDITTNKRLVRNYVDCLVNLKPCTPEGKSLKRLLPEALRTKCLRCTERQKKAAVKMIKRLKYDFPEEWAKLSARWDPTGDFTRYFEEYLAKEAFNTIDTSANEITESVSSVSTQEITSSSTTTTTPIPSVETTKPVVPVLLNRFGDDEDQMMGTAPPTSSAPRPASTTRVPLKPLMWNTTAIPTKSTPAAWLGAASDAIPTKYRPSTDENPPLTTAITIIDQIGQKIIRTTELVTDILKNTVRAVVG